ncbi:MAG TPA: YceI family protein [Edaphobacter sp.]|uniref:YceI family protein n=1 Tax=Edaphobacter sp. TaxID=1934404 RepID=UPI002B664F7B|nr:YceI family protein [Edaphobacter sp.]HUZ94872.1 YceI family protein [Edaphobacter sp.]
MNKTIPNLRCVLAMVVITLLAASAGAQSSPAKMTLHFDPAATKIDWTLKDILHTVHGTFQLKRGVLVFDEDAGTADGEIIVETASAESGNHLRDERMKKDVLESTKYPEAIFHPEKVTGVVHDGQTQTVTVEGTFTIHGADHPLFLQVRTSLSDGKLNATTSFVVPYVAWGMKDPSTLMLRVGKDVQVKVEARATVQ